MPSLLFYIQGKTCCEKKAFKVKGYLKAYPMNHTGEKPYKGNYIDKKIYVKVKKHCLWVHRKKSYQ